MEDQKLHTKLPWATQRGKSTIGTGEFYIFPAGAALDHPHTASTFNIGWIQAPVPEKLDTVDEKAAWEARKKANAEFIITACNNHYLLLSAITNMAAEMDNYTPLIEEQTADDDPHCFQDWCRAMKDAEALIDQLDIMPVQPTEHIFVTDITGTHGLTVLTNRTEEGATKDLFEYVTDNWEADKFGDIPTEPDQAIERYFDTSQKNCIDEYYETHPHEIGE